MGEQQEAAFPDVRAMDARRRLPIGRHHPCARYGHRRDGIPMAAVVCFRLEIEL